MEPEQAIEVITKISFMQDLKPDTRKKLAAIFSVLGPVESVPVSTVLFRKGEKADDRGVILLEGRIGVDKDDSPEITAEAPQLLGEMSQFSPNKVRTATVSADTELKAIQFKWADFKTRAQESLSTDELNDLFNALEDYAWEHFTQG